MKRLPVSPLRALAALLLCAACAGKPDVAITAPASGAVLTAADDLDPAAALMQIAVDATTSAPDGSEAFATAGSARARATAHGGRVHFPSVTLPDGPVTLSVAVVDAGSHRAGSGLASLEVDSLAQGCRFTSPADHSLVATDPGDTGLVSVPVAVLCRGLRAGAVLTLANGIGGPSTSSSVGAAGTAAFQVHLEPGDNLLVLSWGDAGFRVLTVTLQSQRCTAVVAPASGTRFNAAGNVAGSIADRDPAAPGEQARLTVSTGCPAGTPARLAVTSKGAVVASPTAQIGAGGTAVFDLTLPEGAPVVQAFVGAPGQSGASLPAAYVVDSLVPVATIVAPADGASFTNADDAAPAPGFQTVVSGSVTHLDQGDVAVLHVDEGAGAGGADYVLAVDAAGAFQQQITLESGPHALRVTAERNSSGNAGASGTTSISVDYRANTLAFASPLDGDALGGARLTPVAGGAQAIFSVTGAGLDGATVTVRCGPSQGTSVLSSGAAQVTLTLPFAGCGATPFTCTASAALANGVVFSAAPISISADAVAPAVTLAAPASGTSTYAASVDVHATTGCPAEPQTFTLLVNNARVVKAPVSGNAVDLTGAQGAALAPGANQLELDVTDGAGNAGRATATVTQLVGIPAPVVLAPADGASLTAADDVDPATPGVQATATVQLDNRPAGSVVSLVVHDVEANTDSAPLLSPTSVAAGGHLVATFTASLPEGSSILRACATDPVPGAPRSACAADVHLAVNASGTICNITAPADGAVLGNADDTRPDLTGFQTNMRVQTSGDGAVTLRLTVPDGSTSSLAQTPAGGGLQTETFADVALPTDGKYTLDATCARSAGGQGRAVPVSVTLRRSGPGTTFVAPAAPYVLNAAAPDTGAAAGFQTDVQVQITGGDGGNAALSVQCDGGAVQPYGPVVVPAGGLVTFAAVTLLQSDPGDASCTLTASATDTAGNVGAAAQIAVAVDRTVPAPAFTAPQSGAVFANGAPEVDCGASPPVIHTVTLALADAVLPAGFALRSGTNLVSAAPVQVAGGWQWTEVPVQIGANTLTLAATDPAGNSAATSTTFSACVGVAAFQFTAGGDAQGYAQDQDHGTAGEQSGISVTSALSDGSTVRMCSSLADQTQTSCDGGSTWPLAPDGAVPVLVNGSVTFTQTLPDGASQLLLAQVQDSGLTQSSRSRTVTVRATPPVISALSVRGDGGNGSFNQSELDAIRNGDGNMHFAVTVQSGATGGKALQVYASPGGALGSVLSSGPGTPVDVAVPLSAIPTTSGYQDLVFYALVSDDAGNVSCAPGATCPAGVTAITLSETIAPLPQVSLRAPAGSAPLNVSNDLRCSASPPEAGCGTDTTFLKYRLQGHTNALGASATFKVAGTGATTFSVTPPVGATDFDSPSLIPDGPAQVFSVDVTDQYGNVASSATVGPLVVKGLRPSLSYSTTSPVTGASWPVSVTAGNLDPAPYVTSISITSNLDGQVGSGSCTGNCSGASTSIDLLTGSPPPGTQHTLTATLTDSAGNIATYAQSVFSEVSLSVSVSTPVPRDSGGVAWFGLGGVCTQALQAKAPQAPDGSLIELWISAANDCSTPPSPCSGGSCAILPALNGAADFTGALSALANGSAGWLCAKATVAASSATGKPLQFGCDTSTPAVAFLTPASNTVFVAQPPAGVALAAGSVANEIADANSLQAEVSFSVTAAVKGDLKVVLRLDGVAIPGTALSLPQVPASAAPVCYLTPGLGTNPPNCLNGALAPAAMTVAQALKLGHTLTAQVTGPSGNLGSVDLAVQIDIAPPAAATSIALAPAGSDPGFSPRLAGALRVHVTGTPTDDATGSYNNVPPPAWQARFLPSGTLNDSNWAMATAIPVSATPGGGDFTLEAPSDQATLSIGVRAVDRVGNLSPLIATSVSTQLAPSPHAPLVSIPLGQAPPSTHTTTSTDGDAPQMRVADVDGDGFDDVILSYADDASGDGRIYIYFGGAAGLGTTPMVLAPTLPPGSFSQLGVGQSFDVGYFDNDAIADIVAGESDCSTAGIVDIWTGKSIAAARAASGTPAPVTITGDANNFIGGTVRAVGHATSAGADKLTDLAFSSFTTGCTNASGAYQLYVLPRAGSWLPAAGNVPRTAALAASGALTWNLPVATSPVSGQASYAAQVEAVALDALDAASSADSLFVSVIEVVNKITIFFAQRAFHVPPGAVEWSGGVDVPLPSTDNVTPTGVHLLSASGGRNVLAGSSKKDLALAFGTSALYLYDGSKLLDGVSGPALKLDPSFENVQGVASYGVGTCALLLPDLDGDGKAEFTGCEADASQSLNVYLGFGGTGGFDFLGSQASAIPLASGQRISMPDTAYKRVGQGIGVGHVTAKTGYDLVLFSHGSASSIDLITLLR